MVRRVHALVVLESQARGKCDLGYDSISHRMKMKENEDRLGNLLFDGYIPSMRSVHFQLKCNERYDINGRFTEFHCMRLGNKLTGTVY